VAGPLQIKLWPEASKGTHPGLRCDPGDPSGTKVPLVITSNRPLDNLSFRFETEGGQLLEQGTGLRTDQSEYGWFEKQPANKVIDPASFQDSVQTCVLMHTDGEGDFHVPRTGLFSLTATGRAFLPPDGTPSETTENVTFNGSASHPSAAPPVTFWHENDYDLQMLVPQHQFDKVNVSLLVGVQDTSACKPGSDWVPQPNTLEPKPGAGPYDPDYTHYTVWDFHLESAADYTACVKLYRNEKPFSTEAYHLETPHAFSLGFEVNSVVTMHKVEANQLYVQMRGAEVCDGASPIGPFPTDDIDPKYGTWNPLYKSSETTYIHGLCWTANRPIVGAETNSYGTRFVVLDGLMDETKLAGQVYTGHVYGSRFVPVPVLDRPSECIKNPPYKTGDCVLQYSLPYFPRTLCGQDFSFFGGQADTDNCADPTLRLMVNVTVLGGPERPQDRAWVVTQLPS